MSQTLTTSRHPAKTRALLWFWYFCSMGLIYGALVLSFAELRTPKILGYLGLVIALTCFLGYYAFFHSNEWFQAQEEKSATWRAKHPRLNATMTILIWAVLIACAFGPSLWRHFNNYGAGSIKH